MVSISCWGMFPLFPIKVTEWGIVYEECPAWAREGRF